MTERKAFKDYFDRAAASELATQISGAMPRFDRGKFVRLASRDLGKLEFTGRVRQFSDALAVTLPSPVPEALAVLSESLPEPPPSCDAVTDGWRQWPVGQFVADHGLAHFEESMGMMLELTKRFTSEFAVRPFVEHRPEETFARLLALTDDPNPHVRRWCSEGTRPRLPWGRKLRSLIADPTPIWPILEALKDDREPYVRRSIANNLNDIAKDHPALVVERCKSWSENSKGGRDWVIKRALRSLVKAGNPAALAAVGYAPPHELTPELSIRPEQVAIGGWVELSARLETSAASAQDLIVDYLVHYVRRGDRSSGKVFKWTTTCLPARGVALLEKRHPMRPTTIRALYPGRH